ncbi:hypothetical protein [Bilophila wadsworthia]|uniref:hypothetical protein n=1 Tax=Bilophila wadsworthia TaxID=35833 RepID=UPI00242B95EF|nr:hypothetical protein [Bilophila wadsworthia]
MIITLLRLLIQSPAEEEKPRLTVRAGLLLRGAFLVLRFDLALPFPVGGVDGPTVRVVFGDAEPGCRLL